MDWTVQMRAWQHFLRDGFPDSQPLVIVACSGGVDSMVLLDRLCALQRQMAELIVEVAHVNYGLRGRDSDLDQELVVKQASQLSCRYHVLRAEKAPTNGIQEWARGLRRRFFEQCLADRSGVIAVAHQNDDLAENVLLRMSRGCGIDLAGMSHFDPPYWRPILDIPRQVLLDWAERQNVPYRDDKSNDKLIYSRNKIRHEVLPQLEAIHAGASGRIAELARDFRELDAYLSGLFDEVVQAESLSFEAVRSLPPVVGKHVLASFIKRHAGPIQLSRPLLERVWSRLKACEGRADTWSEDLPGSYKMQIDKRGLRLIVKTESFSLRARQHRANIRNLHMPAQLENGARLTLFDAK